MSSFAKRFAPRRRLAALLLAAAAALTWSCTPDPVAISFADYLDHQRDNLATGLISVPHEVNSHLLTYGWRLAEEEPRYAELAHGIGHIRLFGAGEPVQRLVFQGTLERPGRYRVSINEQPLGTVTFDSDPRPRQLDLPPLSVRSGPNLLALRCLDCPAGERHTGAKLRLSQLRLLPAPAHRRGIRATGRDSFLLPVPAYLDVVAELPEAASFRGELSLREAPAEGVTVALSVLDDDGEHLAHRWRLGSGRSQLRADLGSWAGRLVRLRLSAEAAGPVELDWDRAVVVGRGGSPRGGRPPVAELEAPTPSARLGRPDIVMVLLDAARADAFQPFGGPYPTPALAGLAAQGTSFAEAWAPSSWTQPSVAALLTGFYPDSIGSDAWGSGLRSSTPTLAELLAAAGYRTVLWHQHPFYRGERNLRRGFSEVHWARTNLVDPVPPRELLTSEDGPTFAFLHLLPPHTPYEPPAPFRGALSSWYTGDEEVTAQALNRFHNRRDPAELSTEDRRYIRDRYQENAAYADSLVGRVRDLLLAGGSFGETLLIVLSDHGESFLEHDRFLHTQQLYGESIKVPLIIKWPAVIDEFRASVDAPISLVDLLPTLVDGLGLSSERRFQGRSLLSAALDGRNRERPIYAVTRGSTESWRPPATRAAYRYGRWKAIYAPLVDRLELYDVVDDPDELIDLAATRPLTAQLLRQALLEQMALNAGLLSPGPEPPPEPLDADLEGRLRDLGYLGSG